jgi:hypothetical protein
MGFLVNYIMSRRQFIGNRNNCRGLMEQSKAYGSMSRE